MKSGFSPDMMSNQEVNRTARKAAQAGYFYVMHHQDLEIRYDTKHNLYRRANFFRKDAKV